MLCPLSSLGLPAIHIGIRTNSPLLHPLLPFPRARRGCGCAQTNVYLPSFFFCLRGGVTGLPMFIPPYGYFAFFSAGFKICNARQQLCNADRTGNRRMGLCMTRKEKVQDRGWGDKRDGTCMEDKEYVRTWNEHSNVSSTLIIAPALSNSPQ